MQILKTTYGYVESYGEYGVVFTLARSKAKRFDDAQEVKSMLEERHLVYKFEVEEE